MGDSPGVSFSPLVDWQEEGVLVNRRKKANFVGAQITVTDDPANNRILITSTAGGGDMLAATYDPGSVAGDAFDTDNHSDGSTNGVYTLAERSKLAGIEATADITDATNVAAAGAMMIGTDYAKRIVMVKLIDDATALATGDGKFYFAVPAELNGYNLVAAHAFVSTASSSGTPTYQIHNLTDTSDMLSTLITIDANEYTSYTAATPPVINASEDDVVTGDMLRIDKDVAGTGEKGDGIILSFQVP